MTVSTDVLRQTACDLGCSLVPILDTTGSSIALATLDESLLLVLFTQHSRGHSLLEGRLLLLEDVHLGHFVKVLNCLARGFRR